MKIADKSKVAAAKGAAAYATYKSISKAAKKMVDQFAHTWEIDTDYLPATATAAKSVIVNHQLSLPGMSKRMVEHSLRRESDEPTFRSETWVALSLPGTPRFVQAKANYDTVFFRAMRLRDLEVVRALVAEVEADEEAEVFDFDPFEYTPTTDIMAWDAKQGQWDFRKSRTSRSFRSVFLPAELQAEIEADLSAFRESRERLQRLELPWRRGYLLSGPPGVGKTSLSLAIAGSLKFNLASLSLTDITSDGMLRQAVSQLRKNTVLVIEDIDAYSVSRDRDHNSSQDGALSLSGLLNSLDGFETPDGLVTIATTNHIEHLDPALIRSGRLDRTFGLDFIQAAELERLFTWFYEVPVPSAAPAATGDAGITPAEVTELFKQHLNEPEDGWAKVLDVIEENATPRSTQRRWMDVPA